MANSPKTSQKPENTHRPSPPGGKLGQIIRLLQRTKGATIGDMVETTGWQPHSVRGAISGSLKKRHGLAIAASTDEVRGRVYRLPKTVRVGGAK